VTSKRFLMRIFSFLFLGLLMVSSPSYATKEKRLTPMELQAIQSREFEVSKEMAFGAVMTVIQDLGYTVESADLISGFVTAVSLTQDKTNFLQAIVGTSASGNTIMTVFLMEMPNGMTKIRLNFVNSNSVSTENGRASRRDKSILDPAVYNNAWERIDEALFVMGALADTSTPTAPPASAKPSAPAQNGNANPRDTHSSGSKPAPESTEGRVRNNQVEADGGVK